MSILVIFFVPLCFFTVLNCGFCIVSKRPFGECIILTLSMPVILMYYTQFIFRSFNAGFYILLVLAVFSLGLIIEEYRKDKKTVQQILLSPGMLAFVTIYFFFFIIDFRRPFTTWDELNHWGKMVKEILRTDRFYSEPISQLIKHKDYPPFISIYQVLWCKLCGSYCEMTVSLATHVFSFSLFFPLIIEKSIKKGEKLLAGIKSTLLFFILLLIILFLDPYHIFMTIYMDVCIGLLFSFCMYKVYEDRISKSNHDMVCLAVMLTALIQVKQIGMAFFLIIIFYTIINSIANIKKAGNDIKAINTGRLLFSFLFPIINHILWTLYVKRLNLSGQFDLDRIKYSEILGIITGRKTGLQYETCINFIHQLFIRNLSTGFIPVSFVTSMIPILAIIFILCLKYKTYFDRKSGIILGTTYILGAIGYAAVMLVLYMFCFEKNEMRNFGSFNRYMASYVLGELFLLILIFFDIRYQMDAETEDCSDSETNGIVILFVTLFVASIISFSNIRFLVPQYIKGDPLANYRDLASYLESETEPGSRIFLVADGGGNDGFQVFISYYADDRIIWHNSWGIMFPLSYDYESSPEKMDKIISAFGDNDYVYIINTNDNFDSHFSELNEGRPFEEGKVYKVIKKEDGRISLI